MRGKKSVHTSEGAHTCAHAGGTHMGAHTHPAMHCPRSPQPRLQCWVAENAQPRVAPRVGKPEMGTFEASVEAADTSVSASDFF